MTEYEAKRRRRGPSTTIALQTNLPSRSTQSLATILQSAPLVRLLQIDDIYVWISELMGRNAWTTCRRVCSELNQTVVDGVCDICLKVEKDLDRMALVRLFARLKNIRTIRVSYHKTVHIAYYGCKDSDVAEEPLKSIMESIPCLSSLVDLQLVALDQQRQQQKYRCRGMSPRKYPNVVDLGFVSYCTSLVALDLSQTCLSKNISKIGTLTVLQKLDLSDTKISDVAALGNLTALQVLNLSGNRVSGITAIRNLTALQVLNLSCTQVSDITAIRNLTALQVLDLALTQVSDVAALDSLTALQKLNLSDTQVSDVAALGNLTAIQVLNLARTHVSDITAIRHLTALQVVNLARTHVSDITAVRNFKALQVLNLSCTQVSDITAIRNLTALEVLDLSCTQVSDVAALGNLTALQKLNLALTQVSDITVIRNLTVMTGPGWYSSFANQEYTNT